MRLHGLYTIGPRCADQSRCILDCMSARPIEDRELVLDKHRFGHDGTGAAGTREPGDGRHQMQKKDGQIAHRTILARLRHAQEFLTIVEFAMHR